MPKKRTKKTKARKIKKTTRKAVKRKVKKVRKIRKVRKAKGVAKKTKKATKKTSAAIGKVTHYYDKISVAIIELKSGLRHGDTVTFRRGDHAFTQRADSMQIEHTPVMQAGKGDVIGLKVKKPIKDGAVVLKG